MTQVTAFFHDGKSSAQRVVLIEATAPDRLRVTGDGIDLSYPLTDVRVSPRVGNTRRYLYFADGSQCETADNDAIDLIFSAQTGTLASLLHRWESRFGYALLALALTLLAIWGGISYGVPALAKHVAFSLPASTETAMGQNALASLDQFLFAPSQLADARQRELSGIFADMTTGLDRGQAYRLEFRRSDKLGANAIALPSGIIVITDDLVQLAKNNDELIAVLAHEIGHLKYRHALRRVLQDSATALIITGITGDITSITALATTVPTVLVQAKFSRDFEREADEFAIQYLQARGIALDSFAEILLRMEKQKPTAHDVPNYLSTHPATRERVDRSQQHK